MLLRRTLVVIALCAGTWKFIHIAALYFTYCICGKAMRMRASLLSIQCRDPTSVTWQSTLQIVSPFLALRLLDRLVYPGPSPPWFICNLAIMGFGNRLSLTLSFRHSSVGTRVPQPAIRSCFPSLFFPSRWGGAISKIYIKYHRCNFSIYFALWVFSSVSQFVHQRFTSSVWIWKSAKLFSY